MFLEPKKCQKFILSKKDIPKAMNNNPEIKLLQKTLTSFFPRLIVIPEEYKKDNLPLPNFLTIMAKITKGTNMPSKKTNRRKKTAGEPVCTVASVRTAPNTGALQVPDVKPKNKPKINGSTLLA